METEKIALWSSEAPVEDGITEIAHSFITVHHPAVANGTIIIICPGGGYGGLVTGAEGFGIAQWLEANGITGVVLEYRLPRGKPWRAISDVQRAIRIVRSKAGLWQMHSCKVGVLGFSAGGHLASTAATHLDLENPGADDPLRAWCCRPDFAMLIYPLITMGPGTHEESKRNFLGDFPEQNLVHLFSNENHVTTHTPPTFLAHALDDSVVSAENSRIFHDALRSHNVPVEYLELPEGGHGLNGYQGPMWDEWQLQSLQWLKRIQDRI